MNLGIETETLEFKRSTGELKEAVQSICAILNKHRHGELYFGVTVDGIPVGQIVTEESLREVSQKIKNFIEPKIYPEISKVVIDGRECIYQRTDLPELSLAYAITIHKSQGSEFPVVIIPIMGGSPLLMNKNLLYTAVTRAKKMVILIGKSANIYYMVMNKSSAIRHTMLRQLLDKREGLFKDLDISE